MRWIRFLIVLLIVTLINASNLLDAISIGSLSIKPDLLLILLVFFAINCETSEAIISSFAIGFAADISGAAMAMGPYMISFGIFGTVISFFRRSVIMEKLIYQGISILIMGLIAIVTAEAMIFSKLSGYTANSFKVIAMISLYSALTGPFIWFVFSAIFELLLANQPHFGRNSER